MCWSKMKVESNRTKTRYSFICEDEKDKEFLGKMNKYIDGLEEENKKLNEKVRFLEECLDRKEKLNEKYRKELKSTYVYDAKQVRDIC